MLEKLLIGAGAMKAGTTWLYKQLEAHPHIRFTPEKEIHYFSHINELGHKLDHAKRLEKLERVIARGAKENLVNWYKRYALPEELNDDWYSALFDGLPKKAYCADFSNQYSLLPEKSLEQIQKIAADVKVIYTLRDPLARLWSHVKFQYKFVGDEHRVDDIDVTEFKRMINKTWFWENTRYVDNYDRLVRVFGKDNVKLLYLEDFIAFPQGSLWNIEKFLHIKHIEFKADAANAKVNKTKELAMPEQWEKIAKRKLLPIYQELYARGLNHPSWRL
ncbi:MAG: sulfotransferase [Methylovulum sp.]|nr:sulfotransferase [Methylovulum sp.]